MSILFITFIVKHKKTIIQFMVPNKLFMVAEFAWKLGYSVVNVLNKWTTCQKKIIYIYIYIYRHTHTQKQYVKLHRPNKINK